MSKPIIEVRGISKRYQLGAIGATRLRDDLERAWHRLTGRAEKRDQSEFWALKDVTFSVQAGEILGVVGRNGAGKSTLLKVLSRITEPTQGEIVLRGRVGSLLEVGTGFHGDLSGRENIFLNGAILGMSRTEVRRKLDEIVGFAEIDGFVDTPVKRYSSGMYVRLAFAVAAHLEPEILILDEVLAVGDATFQKKCIAKMRQVSRDHGRTILFVSHQLSNLSNLCTHGLLLRDGCSVFEGTVEETIQTYLQSGGVKDGEITWDSTTAPRNGNVRLRFFRVLVDGVPSADVGIDSAIQIELEFEVLTAGMKLSTSFHLLDGMGICILATANFSSAMTGEDPFSGQQYPSGVYRSRCEVPANFLNENVYFLSCFVVSDFHVIEVEAREAVRFHAHDTGEMRKEYTSGWIGSIRPKLAWITEQVAS